MTGENVDIIDIYQPIANRYFYPTSIEELSDNDKYIHIWSRKSEVDDDNIFEALDVLREYFIQKNSTTDNCVILFGNDNARVITPENVHNIKFEK